MAMGLFQILKEAFTAVPTFDDLNDEFYDGLEEALILADVGADTAADTVAQLRKRVKERFIGRMDEVKDALRDILKSKLEVGDSALVLEGKPAVVLVIGVNGVGKTTSIGKLAKQLKDQGKKVLLKIAILEAVRIILAIIAYNLNLQVHMLRTTFPVLIFVIAMYMKFARDAKGS